MSGGFDINQLSEHLFRRESGKMVAMLTKVFGPENLEISEDVVQDAFISAMHVWSLKGVPANPSAWLFAAAKNKAIDILRRNKFSTTFDFHDTDRLLLKSGYTLEAAADKIMNADEITDDLLRMMFACCHPKIPADNQIILILKTLCGFSNGEIAKAFLISEENVAKKLYRTKVFFRENRIKPEFPKAYEIHERSGAVLKSIYLIFNEGYNSTHSTQWIRKDLVDQAMYLCSLLADNSHTITPQTNAAMALMCFHAARLNSRISDEGDIILLAHQDRSKWDNRLISQGVEYLDKSANGDEITAYHAEAAIAYEHCIAKRFEDTNWNNILSYYNTLAAINPNSVVMLNRLAVIYKVYGFEQTIKEISGTPYKKDWEKNYLYYSLLGEMYSATSTAYAELYLKKAIELTRSDAEKKLLSSKIATLTHN